MQTLQKWLLWLALCWLTLARALAAESGSAPEMHLIDAKTGAPSTALLMNMAVNGNINGMVAGVHISQIFTNPGDGWVNGTYVFPLPENAAVNELTFIVNGRKIAAQIKERAQAQQVFEQAKRAGKQAALLEQERPNLFTMNIANIPPHASVQADIHYVELARYDNGQFSLRLPTTLTPRYMPGSAAASNSVVQDDGQVVPLQSGNGWASNTAAVPDAARISPPQTRASSGQNYSVDINLNSGLPLAKVTGSQALVVSNSNGRHHVRLQAGSARMDSDFVLSWQPQAGSEPQAAAFTQTLNGQQYTMLMLVPPSQAARATAPRQLVFVIDSSGSMAGESMDQAKAGLLQALSYLNPGDTFNIIDFDSEARALFPITVAANEANVQRAQQFIRGLEADGGTEIDTALSLATQMTQQPDNSTRNAQIVFITDGSVGNERQIFENLQGKLGNTRLFTVGIGSAPNSYFMQKAAQYGRGSYTYIGNSNEVAAQIAALFAKIQAPQLRNIRVNWGVQTDAYPQHIPDLYAGEPLLLLAQSQAAPKQFSVSADGNTGTWQRSLDLSQSANSDNLATVWARRKIDNISDSLNLGLIGRDEARDQILPLALAHRLLSEFTSFVAVEEVVSKPQAELPQDLAVANLMPAGSTMAAPYPQTATAAALLQWLGLLLLLTAALWWQWQQRLAKRTA